MMTRLISAIAAILILATSAGCTHGHINGDLDGQWQVRSIELPDGTVEKPSAIYYCLFLHTFNLHGSGIISGNMTYDADAATLTLDAPRADLKALRPYGIFSNPVDFDIKVLTSEKLVLENTDATIVLRKF